MAGKRKASPKAGLHHGQRRIKRRGIAPVERDSKGWSPQARTLPLSQPLAVSTPSTSSISPKVIMPEQPNKPLDQLPCPVELLHGPRTAAKATQIFDHLIAYYQRQTVKAAKAQTSDIFRNLHTLKLCIAHSNGFLGRRSCKLTEPGVSDLKLYGQHQPFQQSSRDSGI
jgi:hypothetical protein